MDWDFYKNKTFGLCYKHVTIKVNNREELIKLIIVGGTAIVGMFVLILVFWFLKKRYFSSLVNNDASYDPEAFKRQTPIKKTSIFYTLDVENIDRSVPPPLACLPTSASTMIGLDRRPLPRLPIQQSQSDRIEGSLRGHSHAEIREKTHYTPEEMRPPRPQREAPLVPYIPQDGRPRLPDPEYPAQYTEPIFWTASKINRETGTINGKESTV